MPDRRIEYAGSVHDQREIDAVVAVLQGGPTALRIGKHVRAMEQRVAELFGKRRGVMCNSGLVGAVPRGRGARPGAGRRDRHLGGHVLHRRRARCSAPGSCPAFVDVTPTTFQIDVDAIEEMIGPRTKAILAPNLIGNAPDWDAIAEIARRHGLKVVEDSCDALGLDAPRHAHRHTRRHQPHQLRAVAHHHRGGHRAAWCASTTTTLADRALLLRRWGRRSETQLFGSKKGVERRFFSTIDGDLEYDNLFIFDEVGWNFEPSELSAAFGLVQLDKLDENLKRRQRNFELTSEALRPPPGRVHAPEAHARRRPPAGTCSRC